MKKAERERQLIALWEQTPKDQRTMNDVLIFNAWLEQNRPELVTGTRRTGTGRVCAAHAQINATIQPTTVQPKSRFTAKINPASDLSRPMIAGRKYIRPRNRKKSMASLS